MKGEVGAGGEGGGRGWRRGRRGREVEAGGGETEVWYPVVLQYPCDQLVSGSKHLEILR